MTSSYNIGAQVTMVMYVYNDLQQLTDAATTTLVLVHPDGSESSPGAFTKTDTGTYTFTYTTEEVGVFGWYGSSTTPITNTGIERFRVRDLVLDYATLNDLKEMLQVEYTVDDSQLYIALDAAQGWVEAHYQVFSRATAASPRVFRGVSGEVLRVDPVATTDGLVVAASNGDGTFTDLDAASWLPCPDNASSYGMPVTGIRLLSGCWNPGVYGVQVTGVWGWPTVPAEVTDATLLLASRLFKRKDSPGGVAGFGDFGAVRITTVDVDVTNLLARFAPMLVA